MQVVILGGSTTRCLHFNWGFPLSKSEYYLLYHSSIWEAHFTYWNSIESAALEKEQTGKSCSRGVKRPLSKCFMLGNENYLSCQMIRAKIC